MVKIGETKTTNIITRKIYRHVWTVGRPSQVIWLVGQYSEVCGGPRLCGRVYTAAVGRSVSIRARVFVFNSCDQWVQCGPGKAWRSTERIHRYMKWPREAEFV